MKLRRITKFDWFNWTYRWWYLSSLNLNYTTIDNYQGKQTCCPRSFSCRFYWEFSIFSDFPAKFYQAVKLCELSITLVFLQQLRQIQKQTILKPKFSNQLCMQQYLSSRLVQVCGNLLAVNLEILERIILSLIGKKTTFVWWKCFRVFLKNIGF